MFGFFNVSKPVGPTSHDVVAQVRRRLGRGVKLGHAGTLDPFAEGVLVLCAGPATRLASYVQAQPKRYVAEIRLAATSTTDDPQGQVTPTPAAAGPDQQEVREALARFVGEVEQVPPAHSAVRVGGRRAYKLARAGEEVSLPARPVRIHAIELLRYDYPVLEIDVRCGRGTYIRSLARDVGAALAVGGYCARLIRTEVGAFRIGEAVAPGDLDPRRDLVGPLAALADLAKVTVNDRAWRRLSMGQPVVLEPGAPPGDPEPGRRDSAPTREVAVLNPVGDLVAIAELRTHVGRLHPTKVFVRPGSDR